MKGIGLWGIITIMLYFFSGWACLFQNAHRVEAVNYIAKKSNGLFIHNCTVMMTHSQLARK